MKSNGFFTDNEGNKSLVRVMTFMYTITAILIAFFTIYIVSSNKDNNLAGNVGLSLVGILTGVSMTGKVTQKYVEEKYLNKSNSVNEIG